MASPNFSFLILVLDVMFFKDFFRNERMLCCDLTYSERNGELATRCQCLATGVNCAPQILTTPTRVCHFNSLNHDGRDVFIRIPGLVSEKTATSRRFMMLNLLR